MGVAVTAGAGYLVAALVLFPAPLLPNEREVARVLGIGEDDARRQLEAQGFGVDITGREPHPTASTGTVVWQDPPPGVVVPREARVELVVSSGAPRVAVPDVRGYDRDLAAQVLAATGIGVELVDTIGAKGLPPGVVAGTSPAAGDSVPLGLRLTLHLVR